MTNTTSDNHQKKNQDSESISESRRKLIYASAAAPLVATLHSGSAWANVSAFQCMDDVKNAKGVQFSEGVDNAVRIKVPYYRKLKSDGALKKHIYEIADNTYYYGNGTEYTGKLKKLVRQDDAYVLQLYTPNSKNTCASKAGLWPQVRVSNDNIPINGTCLTSMIVSDNCDITL